MLTLTLFGISVVFSLIAWTGKAHQYISPELRERKTVPLRCGPKSLMLHSFRFVGLSFLIPGMGVGPTYPGLSLVRQRMGTWRLQSSRCLHLQRCAQVQAQF